MTLREPICYRDDASRCGNRIGTQELQYFLENQTSDFDDYLTRWCLMMIEV